MTYVNAARRTVRGHDARVPQAPAADSNYDSGRMGMNAVRFYMNYRTFEADAAPGKYLDDGWQWLDDNIAWAGDALDVGAASGHCPHERLK